MRRYWRSVATRSAATSQRGRFFASGVPAKSCARDVAHAAVDEPVLVLGDEVDERREHGLVNRAVVGRLLRACASASALHELVQLVVHVVPLAQARDRQIVLLAPAAQRALAVAPLAPVRRPEVQSNVVNSERGSANTSCLRRAASGSTPYSRGSTTLERGRDHEPFAQRVVAVRDDEQPRDARIDRQPRHELAVAA